MSRNLTLTLALAAPALLLAGCEVGTKVVQQTGPRGSGMDYVADKSSMIKVAAVPAPTYPLTPEMRQGERASAAYQNVKVLGDLSTEEFNHAMASITQWVAPEQGCNYCHNPENMASDEIYTKVVARRMIQMTRNINTNWKGHVQQTGVTCWTCHRGNVVPANSWSIAAASGTTIKGNKHGQNTPSPITAYASLPYDPFTSYLQGANNIRVAANSPYPSKDHVVPIQQTERTYALMMHTSQALGVNCTYCHNTQSFRSWTESRPQRVVAWYGYRLVRQANDDYINSLSGVWPANRRGPGGDPYKINCATCHQGVNKPMGGVSMVPDHPWVAQPNVTPVAAPVEAAPADTMPTQAVPVAAVDAGKPPA